MAAAVAALSGALGVAAVAFRADAAIAARVGSTGGAPFGRVGGGLRSLVGRLGSVRRLRQLAGVDRLARRLALAGAKASVEELVGAKAALAAGAGSLALLGPSPAPLLSPIIVVAAFRFPDLVLAGRVRRRAAQADSELPQLLDVLAAASSAGLSGPLALRRAAETTRGPLAEELGRVVRAVDLGGRWRQELRGAADRLDLADLRRTVGALTRTETLGTSLSEALTELAGQVREARRVAAGERARKAPVKMLFPLVFMILPAFLLLTVVPVLLTTLKSIR